jgi:hypothetical protein
VIGFTVCLLLAPQECGLGKGIGETVGDALGDGGTVEVREVPASVPELVWR